MSEIRTFESNPYAAPQADSRIALSPLATPLAIRPGVPLTATRQFWLPACRHICFSGGIEATLRWNGMWLAETVHLDGALVASVTNWEVRLIERFDFPVDVGYAARMSVELRSVLGCWATAFRVRLDDRTLYEEGYWSDVPDFETPPTRTLPSKPR